MGMNIKYGDTKLNSSIHRHPERQRRICNLRFFRPSVFRMTIGIKYCVPFFLILVGMLSTPAFAKSGKAILEGTSENSELIGIVRFQETDEGLRTEINMFGAEPGLHGIHIHENGSCDGGGNAAGSHYNPEGVKHGFLPREGFSQAHAGDFGNIEINQNGEGLLFLMIPELTLSGGAHNIEGRSVILHEKKDDFSQPTGNAGDRIACGVIEADSES